MIILKINGTDYGTNVIVGSYKVNSQDIYSSWTDANGTDHRHVIRQKISGSFDMQFPTMGTYNAFVSHVNSSKDVAGWVPCQLYVNNISQTKSCKMFMSFSPNMTRIHNNTMNYVAEFTVEVEEQ